MKAEERRNKLIALLTDHAPVSGGVLSEKLSVSRQIIVQDIAILKASGHKIISTHRGYLLEELPAAERVFKVRHTSEQTKDELSLIVSLGGTVLDVFVWHKVYGKIEATLNIFSNHGIEQFLNGIKSGKSSELMHITDGYHYHTVRADSKKTLDAIEKLLAEKNYIVPEI